MIEQKEGESVGEQLSLKMYGRRGLLALVLVLGVAVVAVSPLRAAERNSYTVTPLVSDQPGVAPVTDPDLGINLMMLVHGEQEFEWFDVLRPNDTISCVGEIKQIYDKASKDFVVVETLAKNQHGKLVVRGLWTAVIRHG